MRTEPVLDPLHAVCVRHNLDDVAARLNEMQSFLGDDLALLEAAITGLHQSGPNALDLAEQAAAYLLSRPGKRIRPLCVMLAARLGGRGFDRCVRDIAVAAELVHAATLLHDDVIDEGMDRRGAPAARMSYGNAASVLAGDHLLITALRRVMDCGLPGVLSGLLDVIAEMVAAEALQLDRRGRFEPDRAAYLRVIEGKTAALFRWGLVSGGVVGELSTEHKDALACAGTALGLAFQLVDDAIDLEEDAAHTGKTALSDLREGKLTWPLVIAVERDPGLQSVIRDCIDQGESVIGGALLARIRATGAIAETRAFAAEQARVAEAALATLNPGPAQRALQTVVQTALNRSR